MTRPGIHKSLEAMQALHVSVIFAEHSFRDNPRNTQCSNATAIDCRLQTRPSLSRSVWLRQTKCVPCEQRGGSRLRRSIESCHVSVPYPV